MDGNFLEKIEKFKLPIGLCLLGTVLIVGGVFASGVNKSKPKQFPKESMVGQSKTISIDVSGAVTSPGVYKLKEGDRVEEAIKAAGGFSGQANKEYISKYLNMAQKLSDGSKIYVLFAGESGLSGAPQGVVAGTSTSAKVNINTATQAELEALSGVGPVTASKIISDRPYQDIQEILSKKAVSKAVFEKIKDLLVLY